MANISPYIRIIRPINLLFSALTVMIAAFLLDQMQQSGIIFVAMAVVVTFAAASNILNDIFDINIDSVNQPMRPLPSGEISLSIHPWSEPPWCRREASNAPDQAPENRPGTGQAGQGKSRRRGRKNEGKETKKTTNEGSGRQDRERKH